MHKFLKTVRINHKDEVIKKSIIDQLSNSIKELQYSGAEEGNKYRVVDSTEAANQLCLIIEAIFLHGLKDSLVHRFKKVISDVDVRPEPSFWAPLLIISHKQIIDQILNLPQITTETGQCRAWIRLALNDCLLSSYFLTMKQDSSALKLFYRPGALVRDSELLDVAQRLIEGFEGFKTVSLPCNSSLLNTFLPASLHLAGIWAPTLKACPVAPCDDVAQSMEINFQRIPDNVSETNSFSSAMSITSQNSGFKQMMAFDEDEVLNMILTKSDNTSSSSNYIEKKINLKEPKKIITHIEESPKNLGNSLKQGTGWSSDKTTESKKITCESTDVSDKSNHKETEDQQLENSFNALVDSYNVLHGDYNRTQNLNEVRQKIDGIPVIIDETSTLDNGMEIDDTNQQDVLNAIVHKKESKTLAMQLGEICRERGLDRQNYECFDCKVPFIADQTLNLCAFTGNYFCDNCMSDENIPIPAKIIHNWDFNTYAVSKKSATYINEIKDQPILDFKILNPYIYGIVEEMAELLTLRNQLNYLRAYLYTCREPIIGELQQMIAPREYLYEHVHLYSVNDLAEMCNGTLAQCLRQGVDFGKEHVTNCWLCSQKGFVCEKCNKPKTIFPFDIENVYRCNNCHSIYHKHCLTKSIPCPKCKRWKWRDDPSNLEENIEV